MNRKSKAAEFVDVSYNIDVLGRNVLVTDAMKDYALEKVSKIEKFSHRIINIAVILEVQKINHRCDIVLKVDHIKVKSQATTDDMYASIDKAVDRLERQLKKYKNRIQDHQARPIEELEMNVNILQSLEDALLDVNDDIDEENEKQVLKAYQPHPIVAQEKMKLKYLTNEEAVMKMELSLDSFLVYKSDSDRKLKIMYRKNDGNFAIIEPEL